MYVHTKRLTTYLFTFHHILTEHVSSAVSRNAQYRRRLRRGFSASVQTLTLGGKWTRESL